MDPARTEGSGPSGRGRLRRFGLPGQGPDRSARHGNADQSPDPLHAIYGMPWRTPLLGAFAAGQGQSTTVRWAPLLSLAVPCSMPHTCPKGASELGLI